MKVIVFSKNISISKHINQTLLSSLPDNSYQLKTCQTFSALGVLLAEDHDLLIFHLLTGEEEEKICYQFINTYKQVFKMLVLTNQPDASQGMRIFRAGVRGYANTFSSAEKLEMALKVITQGKVWMGAEVLQKLLTCGLRTSDELATVTESITEGNEKAIGAESISKTKSISFLATIKTNLKKWFT